MACSSSTISPFMAVPVHLRSLPRSHPHLPFSRRPPPPSLSSPSPSRHHHSSVPKLDTKALIGRRHLRRASDDESESESEYEDEDEGVFPDPIPEFARAESEKFERFLLDRLSTKDVFGDSLKEVVAICTEIMSNFLHTEYGGPGTLLVIPFVDMADTIDERGLPGGSQAARSAVVWAQKHVDKDWKEWTGKND